MERKDWQRDIVYQIYPRSFYDSNGDGVGDIPGIIEKLDYIQQLGATAIWLSPVFSSPMKDNGYDISDYYTIDPIFGTNADMKQLIQEAAKRKIKIILDLVINHTSEKNRWFIEARKSRNNPYRDFYIWRDKPNQLQSTFGGSAWEKDPKTNQYYLHLFAKEQPDLNWENPALRQEIYAMMNYWINQGIGGFRMDVIENIGKDPDHLIVANGPHLHDYLQEMAQATFDRHGIMTIGECWNADDDSRILYTDPNRHELSMVFQFEHITAFWDKKYGKWKKNSFSLLPLKKIWFHHEMSHPDKSWNTLFWDNHDTTRALGDDIPEEYRLPGAKMLFGLLAFMSGTLFIYQGDEIGMTNANFTSISEIKDIEAKNAFSLLKKEGFSPSAAEKMVLNSARDNARIPFFWSNEKEGGFTQGKAWLSCPKRSKEWCEKEEEANPNSVLSFYQQTIRIRKQWEDIVLYGSFKPLFANDSSLFSYERAYGKTKLVVVANFSSQTITNPFPEQHEILISNELDNGGETLKPYSFYIFKKTLL